MGGSKLGTAEGRGQGLLAQLSLDRCQVHPDRSQMRSEAVSQVLETEVLDSRPPAGRGKRPLDILVGFPGDRVVRDTGYVQAPPEALQGNPRGGIDGDFPPPSLLRLVQQDKAMPPIYFFIPPQGESLPPSHTSIQGLDFQSTNLRKFEVQPNAFGFASNPVP